MAKVKLINSDAILSTSDVSTEGINGFLEKLDGFVERDSATLSFVNLDNLKKFKPEDVFKISDAYAADGSVLVVYTGESFLDMATECYEMFKSTDWRFRSEMIWVHTNSPASFQNASAYFPSFTKMFVFTHGGGDPKVFNPQTETCKHQMELVDLERKMIGSVIGCVDARTVNQNKIKSGVWVCSRDYSRIDPSDVIIQNHVLSWTNSGMSVIDWTPGEGFVVDVCQKLDRSSYCVCDDENHVKTIEKRVFGNKADEDDQQMLFNL